MDSIGSMIKETRENSGVTIKEASEDLHINENFLLNIEEGKIGCFTDIYELKNYIASYAKYLGLDSDELIDKFNEYLFEYTSKIPVKEIERQAAIQAKEDLNKVISPYTKKTRKYGKSYYLAIYLVIFLLVILAIFWSIKQITVDNHTTDVVSFVKF